MKSTDYVLVTPARNEAGYIDRTLTSVVAQTRPPLRWIIVSDGSTDATDSVVTEFAHKHSFIRLVRKTASERRSFDSKVRAFRLGCEELMDLDSCYIGNLDADVTFAPEYFETLLARMEADPRIGIGGGGICELVNGTFVAQLNSVNSVPGAVQLFRRSCYEQIGGYVPLRMGGIDSAAEIMARMHGWIVRMFTDLIVFHHRRVSSGSHGVLRAKFRHGMCHYSLGCIPSYEAVRCLYRLREQPYGIGSLATFAGYVWSWIQRQQRELPPEVINYVRREQDRRIWSFFALRKWS
jgi:glycosyltransferase involved in cell wall biosynthesis